jgi:hypothetical protein
MWLLILQALGALALLLLVVWWTMFAGRRRGERELPRETAPEPPRNSQPASPGEGAERPGGPPAREG